MKILVISNLYPPSIIGGYEIACRDFTEGLTRLGHQIEVLTTNFGVDKDNPSEGGLDIKFARSLSFSDPEKARNSLIKKIVGIRSVYFDLPNFLISLFKIISFKPDVVYVWNLSFTSISPLVSALILKKKIVLHLEDYWLGASLRFGQNRNQGWLEEGVKKILFHLVTKRIIELPFIAVSGHIRRYYFEQGMTGKSAVVYNGLGLNQLVQSDQLVSSVRKQNTLLYVGRLIEDKGVHLIIEAMRILKDQGFTNYHLDIVGGGESDYIERLRRMIKDYGLSDCVNFLGQKTHEETLKLYPLYSIIVIPSLWEEPFGLVAIEAMSKGCIPILSSSGALPEIVEDERGGLVFQEGNAVDLVKRIRELLSDDFLRQKLAKDGQEATYERFTMEKKIVEVDQFLKALIIK